MNDQNENPNIPEIVEPSKKDVVGLARMEGLMAKRFTEEIIVDMVADLCEAKDVRMTKDGAIETPNWNAREAGLKTVLGLRRFVRKNDPVSGEGAPIKLVFNVTNPNVTIEKKEEKA